MIFRKKQERNEIGRKNKREEKSIRRGRKRQR